MTVIPKKLFLLISGVCVLFIFLYNSRLWREAKDVHPRFDASTTLPSFRHESCSNLSLHPADIETSAIFPTLNLEPPWMERREYWSNQFEDRFQKRKAMWNQLPLKVIVMPHSHNDPGWLKTVEGYFDTSTKSIITNIVNKLTVNKNMTFIWSEASYLSMWWNSAEPSQKKALRKLLDEGRLEITTGGWVMTDEANVDFFSMVDQLIEGHQFMRSVLNVRPTSSWSVDSFGHGGAFPHILGMSDIKNMVIMRIHYVWKEWFARYQQGNFLWKQAWEEDTKNAPLCYNFPYDIYSIKHSCGPAPQTCLGFDFRHLDGEYNEFTPHYTPIDVKNVKSRSELLLEQYGRTGSLVPHNVVLVPLGDDFRYSNEIEFDQQYNNYMKIMDFINTGNYNAHISFGTLSDYFREVRDRMKEFSTLSGDFHVYSDIFSEGRPAYWSGYYFTRPYVKLLGRQVSSKLRGVEILFSLSVALSKELSSSLFFKMQFGLLEESRRALALFQHHDAITGTSKGFVMQDYEDKLMHGLQNLNALESLFTQFLLSKNKDDRKLDEHFFHLNERNKGETNENLRLLNFRISKEHKLIIYNSLPYQTERIGYFVSNTPNICVYDASENLLDSQIAPFYNMSRMKNYDPENFDVWFSVNLQPLSLTAFSIKPCLQGSVKPITKMYCLQCAEQNEKSYQIQKLPPGAIQIENQLYKLLFDSESKLLKSVTNKINQITVPVHIEFAAYKSEAFRSGAYLFSVESGGDDGTGFPLFTSRHIADVSIITGAVFSEIRVLWSVPGSGGMSNFLHTVRLATNSGPLSESIHIENLFDFGPSPNFRDSELFMRFRSGIKNGKDRTLFTDQAGLGFVRRSWSNQAGLEGNYFPVTDSAFIQDTSFRLTVLVDHATGVSSVNEGWLELMVDKRIMYDDGRGMGEGVLDSRLTKHRYTFLLEPLLPSAKLNEENIPFLSPLSYLLQRYLEYPLSILRSIPSIHYKDEIVLLENPFPCGMDLVNLRSWKPSSREDNLPKSLLILRKMATDCKWASLTVSNCQQPTSSPQLSFRNVQADFSPITLTGNFPRSSKARLFDLSPMEIASYNVTFT